MSLHYVRTSRDLWIFMGLVDLCITFALLKRVISRVAARGSDNKKICFRTSQKAKADAARAEPAPWRRTPPAPDLSLSCLSARNDQDCRLGYDYSNNDSLQRRRHMYVTVT